MAIDSIQYFKYGLAIHIVTGAFMVTNTTLLPASEDIEYISIARNFWNDFVGDFGYQFFNRFVIPGHGVAYFGMVIFFLVLTIAKNSVLPLILNILRFVIGCIRCFKRCCSQVKEEKSTITHSQDIYMDMTPTFLEVLYKKSQREIEYLEQDPEGDLGYIMSVVNENRMESEVRWEVDFMETTYERRIK